MPSASSSDETTPPSMFHSLEFTPEENGQWPRSRYPPSTLLARPEGKMKDDAISASGSLFQTSILGAPVEHAEHPVMAGEVGEIPGHRRITLREHIGAIDQRDVIEFGAADPLRLHDPEQAGIMQIAFGLRRQASQLLGLGGTIAQARNQRPGTIDHGGIAADVRGQDLPLAFRQHLPFQRSSAVSPVVAVLRCGRSVRNLLDRSKLSDDCLSPDQ